MNEKETITITGTLKFEKDKVYSHIAIAEKLTELNGCEYFKKLNEKIANRKKRIFDLENELSSEKKLLLVEQNEALSLEQNGYCPIDKEQTRLAGGLKQIVITHRDNCRHKGA